MLVEARVFNRQDGIFHDLGNVFDRGEAAALFAKLGQQRAFRRENPQRQLGAVVR